MGNTGFGGFSSNAPYGGNSGCGCGGSYPSYPTGGYGCGGTGNGFALIVVLFILLIIVGAAFVC